MANIVAIEQIGVEALGVQPLFDGKSAIVDLPAPLKPVNHSMQGF